MSARIVQVDVTKPLPVLHTSLRHDMLWVLVKFGLRPEHIGVGRPGANAVEVPATLRLAEHMGNEVFVHAEVAGVPLTARVPADEAESLHAMARGAPITLNLRMDAAHLFDSASGASLA